MTAGDRLHWRLSPATRFNNSSSSNQLASSTLAHAVLSRQKMYPFTLVVNLSSVTTPLTVMRQPMVVPSPYARRSAKSVGSAVVKVRDHGSGISSTR